MVYKYRVNDLPIETPTLMVIWSGNKFLEAKGLAEIMFEIMGIDFAADREKTTKQNLDWYTAKSLTLGEFGTVGEMNPDLLQKVGITTPLTGLYLDFGKMAEAAHRLKIYQPIPKYPPAFEDMDFIVPGEFQIGPFMDYLRKSDQKVYDVKLLDSFKDTRTFRITYLDPSKNLSQEDIALIRQKIMDMAKRNFGIKIKGV
jgi:phenylalanyl-tRNA synthetase beta subunit